MLANPKHGTKGTTKVTTIMRCQYVKSMIVNLPFLTSPRHTDRIFEGGVEGYTVAYLAGALSRQAGRDVHGRMDSVWAEAEAAVMKIAREYQQVQRTKKFILNERCGRKVNSLWDDFMSPIGRKEVQGIPEE